jgi:hypothetical protein
MRLSDDPASNPAAESDQHAEKEFSPRNSTRLSTMISRNAEQNEKMSVSIRRSTEFASKLTDVRCSQSVKHSELMISTVRGIATDYSSEPWNTLWPIRFRGSQSGREGPNEITEGKDTELPDSRRTATTESWWRT